jgi:glycosyltransferase involved in cell wall biosynthesis
MSDAALVRALPETQGRSLTVIIPVYKNEGSLTELVQRLEALELPQGIECRAVFVVDGSPDRSAAMLRSLLERSTLPSQLLVLSRNFGSFAAIRAGLELADSDYFAVMAADLQEPPELLTSFVDDLVSGEVDLVLGRREGRADPAFSRFSSAVFWRLYRRFVQPEMPEGGVDVFACGRTVRAAILDLHEANSSLVGLLMWVGFRRTTVAYTRLPRSDGGRSSWTFRKKLRYMSDSIFSFTDVPIHLLLFVGFFGSVAATVAAVTVLTMWSMGLIEVAGYTPLMLAILFVGAILTFGLGIVGSYVWRTYENTKARPLAIAQSIEHFPRDHRDD